MPTKPRVWKAGHDCWAVTDDYFCEELNQLMCTTRLLRTWEEAIRYATQQEQS
ncbi:hypothetical protein JY504_00865 [Corynebacterium amycolatum]|uniref:hypothetical protein n=1 Tax=Corynebacterium amycolatum TaxID=43765 RepID=UPI00211A59D8|nr:hypothetical protein [Corynebacterium amycolatum]MCQ9168596.1 hypothetical protein [Corynebacterium amycolatum]MCQ9176071.1 hypothetical protein [Corynebacterium amycolatum]